MLWHKYSLHIVLHGHYKVQTNSETGQKNILLLGKWLQHWQGLDKDMQIFRELWKRFINKPQICSQVAKAILL
jgi:hypothetical protein